MEITFIDMNGFVFAFHLLEKLTADLLNIATESERVSFAEIKVDKPHALRFADSVSVTLSASRE